MMNLPNTLTSPIPFPFPRPPSSSLYRPPLYPFRLTLVLVLPALRVRVFTSLTEDRVEIFVHGLYKQGL